MSVWSDAFRGFGGESRARVTKLALPNILGFLLFLYLP